MDFDLQQWLGLLLQKLQQAFEQRLRFMGLQGSYARGEAMPQSDIDVVVLLDVLTTEDLKVYHTILTSMLENEKACGFISGIAELTHWPRHDLFTFYYDTKPLYGSFDGILQPPTEQDAVAAAKAGAANLYHHLCHTYLHGEDAAEALKAAYKNAFFVLQALYFAKHHIYARTRQELAKVLPETDQFILNIYSKWPECVETAENVNQGYSLLINWCSDILQMQ